MSIRTFIVLTLLGGLAACGGGGGGGGTQAPPPASTPPASPAGIWEGTLTQGDSIVNEGSCLLTVDDELACILFDPSNDALAGAVYGSVQVSNGNQLSGSGTSYAAPGYVLADGVSTLANFTLTGGTVAERSTLELTYSSLGETGSFTGTFDATYDRNSSLETVGGVYTVFDVFGDPAAFTIDDNGVLLSQTQSGCLGNGQVSVIDPRFNSYAVEATVSNCPGLNGEYQGLGVTTDFTGTNDVFLFGIFNSSNVILGAPQK